MLWFCSVVHSFIFSLFLIHVIKTEKIESYLKRYVKLLFFFVQEIFYSYPWVSSQLIIKMDRTVCSCYYFNIIHLSVLIRIHTNWIWNIAHTFEKRDCMNRVYNLTPLLQTHSHLRVEEVEKMHTLCAKSKK